MSEPRDTIIEGGSKTPALPQKVRAASEITIQAGDVSNAKRLRAGVHKGITDTSGRAAYMRCYILSKGATAVSTVECYYVTPT